MAYSSSCRRRVLLALSACGLRFVCTICIVLPRASRFTFRPAHSISSSSSSPPPRRNTPHPTKNPQLSLELFPLLLPHSERACHQCRERGRDPRQRRRAVNNPTRPAGSHISELFTLLNKGDFSRARAPNIAQAGRKKRKEQGDPTASPRRASS